MLAKTGLTLILSLSLLLASCGERKNKADNEAAWQQARLENTVTGYRSYLNEYPTGKFANEAKERMETLSRDDGPYLVAKGRGTREAYETFLEKFPGHQREEEVLAILEDMEGELFDLLDRGKIEVTAVGNGIDKVVLNVRRLVDHEIRLIIPVGTTFVPEDDKVQNMVSIQETEVMLSTDKYASVSVPVACSNMHLEVPLQKDKFTIQRSLHNIDLDRLLNNLAEVEASFLVKQAAVWIVTDDANYAELGKMKIGGRTFQKTDMVLAMKLLDESGLDVTQKAIWRDRGKLLEGLGNQELKNWLVGK